MLLVSFKSIYGVCLHPSYIGWFALRAVIIFQKVLVPDLVYKPPKDILEVFCVSFLVLVYPQSVCINEYINYD